MLLLFECHVLTRYAESLLSEEQSKMNIGGSHFTFALCSTGCVLSALTAAQADSLQKFFVCSNGVCPAGVFTDHMRHSFNAVFIASVTLASTFGYDSLASLIRCLNISLAVEKTQLAHLLMFLTHVANVAMGSFILAACYSNSFVFDSSYTTIKGNQITKIKLFTLAIFVIAIGSALFQHMLRINRAHAHATRKASVLGDMSTLMRTMHRLQ
jgi:hypothetical protein